MEFEPINKEVCAQCGAECCDVSTPFSKEDIKRIKSKHRKLFRGVTVTPTLAEAFNLHKRNNTQCVFLDENKRCKIYEDRPQICKDFGDKPFARCAYNGLDYYPTDPKERKAAAKVQQEAGMMELFKMHGKGHLKPNMIDSGARNVLADDFNAIGKRNR